VILERVGLIAGALVTRRRTTMNPEDLLTVIAAMKLAATVHLDTAISLRHIDRAQCAIEMQEHLKLMRITEDFEASVPQAPEVPVFFRGNGKSAP